MSAEDPPVPNPVAITVAELERVAALGWPGTSVARLGGWLLRAGSGFTGRANSTLPLGDPGCPLPDAIAAVEAFYLVHDLRPQFQVPEPMTGMDRLTARLADRGWSAASGAVMMVAALSEVAALCLDRPDLPPAELAAAPSTDWIAGYRYRGGAVPAAGLAVLMAASAAVFATVSGDGGRMAVARGVVDEGWLGVTAVTVEESFRRTGLATHVLAELIRWARPLGARWAYLQVDAGNDAALRLYERLGFVRHHRYSYWRPS